MTVDGVGFNLTMEEKYQAMLAMAINLSNPKQTEDADTAQLGAAKREDQRFKIISINVSNFGLRRVNQYLFLTLVSDELVFKI